MHLQNKLSVIIPQVTDVNIADLPVHHVFPEKYMLNSVSHNLDNTHSMSFNVKDQIVFTH